MSTVLQAGKSDRLEKFTCPENKSKKDYWKGGKKKKKKKKSGANKTAGKNWKD